MGISEGFVALFEDVIEHDKDSLDSALVGKVLGEGQHNFDHLGPFGSVGEVFEEFLDVVLRFLDLDERSFVSETGHQIDALVESGNGVGQILDGLFVVS